MKPLPPAVVQTKIRRSDDARHGTLAGPSGEAA